MDIRFAQRRFATALLLVAASAFFLSVARAQIAPKPGLEPLANYDVRETVGHTPDAAKAAAARSSYRGRQVNAARASSLAAATRSAASARAALRTAVPNLQTESNRFGTAPEIVGTADAAGFLTAASAASHEDTLRAFLGRHAGVYGLTDTEAAALVKFSDYANPAGNLAWVGLKQEINGLPVFQGELLAAFTATGALARTTGNLAPGLDAAALPSAPALGALEAVVQGSAAIGRKLDTARLTVRSTENAGRTSLVSGGPYAEATRADLMYFPLEPGVATLAYALTFCDSPFGYYVLVDANDGTLLFRKCITQFETNPTAYSVYTSDSPSPLSPTNILPGTGAQAAGVNREVVTLFSDDANASPLGWLNDGITTVVTTGNNCDAGLDAVSPDGIESYGRAIATSGTVTYNGNSVTGNIFNFSYSPPPLGTDAASNYVTGTQTLTPQAAGAVTNLFFWTNRYHDRLWNLGFTEAARNFQTTNTFTINGTSTNRGGTGNDAVLAQVHDYGGTDNANFYTPADGTAGRMQMYIFPDVSPSRDGSLDGDVFLHEMTHGTSNRLHANGSGLATTMAGGMGEGWSDYYARAILSTADEDVDGVYAAGAYVTYKISGSFTSNYYYGIRRFPYAVLSTVGANGKPHNPLTFADVDPNQISLTDGAYAANFTTSSATANEVHNIGEVWCMMLLEVRERLIKRLGFATGNQRALQIVTDAMKLDVASPTMVQARDSIIAADNAGYGGADTGDIRAGFAVRGMGLGATTNGTNVVESYTKALLAGTPTISDTLGNRNGYPDPGEDITINVPLTNYNSVADNTATVTIGTYKVGASPGANGGTATVSVPFRVPATAAAGSTVTVSYAVHGALDDFTRTFSFVVGTPATVLSESFDGVTVPALPTGWTTTTAALTGGTAGTPWATLSSTTVDVANCAYSPDLAGNSTAGGEAALVSPAVTLPSTGSPRLSFKHIYGFEQSSGSNWDGGVLEINIAGGGWTDIVSAGGAFTQNGYNGTLVTQATKNPLSGRTGFVGSSGSALASVVTLPSSALGKSVQFRWRVGFDDTIAGPSGWYVDTVQVIGNYTTAPVDTDGDGLQDGYEIANGLNPNDPTDAALDSDGDGVSNLQEYLAGTDPRSAASVLRITQTAYSPTAGLTVTFPTVNGKVYQLEYKNSLTDAAWTTPSATYTGTGAVFAITFSPSDLGGQTTRFYRVRVTGP